VHAGGESSHKSHENEDDDHTESKTNGQTKNGIQQSDLIPREDQFNVPRGFGDDPENDD